MGEGEDVWDGTEGFVVSVAAGGSGLVLWALPQSNKSPRCLYLLRFGVPIGTQLTLVLGRVRIYKLVQNGRGACRLEAGALRPQKSVSHRTVCLPVFCHIFRQICTQALVTVDTAVPDTCCGSLALLSEISSFAYQLQ